jgi:ABC-type dipeptide/oligopeptide/nickel transport system permease component
MALTIVIGVPVGILAAVKKRTVVDWGIMSVSSLGLSAPLFWTGFLLMYIFAVWLGWLPVISGGAGVKGLILPALSLAVYWGAVVARMTRSSMLEVLSADYTRTARTKGLSELVVVYKHALRNAALPIITVLGLMMGRLFGGAVIAESVFGWPGMGRLIINAIFWRDHALVQSGLLVAGVMFAFINLVVDILYAFLDPRIRYS